MTSARPGDLRRAAASSLSPRRHQPGAGRHQQRCRRVRPHLGAVAERRGVRVAGTRLRCCNVASSCVSAAQGPIRVQPCGSRRPLRPEIARGQHLRPGELDLDLGRRVGVGAGAHDGRCRRRRNSRAAPPRSAWPCATQRNAWLPGTVPSASMPARSITSWPGAKSVTRSRVAPAGLSAMALKSQVSRPPPPVIVSLPVLPWNSLFRASPLNVSARGAQCALDADQRVLLGAALGRVGGAAEVDDQAGR